MSFAVFFLRVGSEFGPDDDDRGGVKNLSRPVLRCYIVAAVDRISTMRLARF